MPRRLPRLGFLGAAAPGRPRDAARGARARVRRSAPAARPGRDARLLLDNARAVVAECLGVRPDEVTLHLLRAPTPCTAACWAVRRGDAPVAYAAVEHSAVVHAAAWAGAEPVVVPVDRLGRVDPAGFGAPASVVAVQSANHEVGTVQPVADLDVAAYRSSSTPAPRWAGSPSPTGWDALAGSAHKWGGPAGVGVLLVRKGVRWVNPFPATTGRRARRVRERPGGAGRRGRAPGRRGGARRGQRPPVRPGRPDPRRGRRDPRRRGGRRPGRPAPPPGDVLLPVRRRRGAGDRARQAGVRRRQRLGVHRVDPRAQPRARGDGRAHPRQRPGLADPRHHRGGRRRLPRRAPRGGPRPSAPRSGCE